MLHAIVRRGINKMLSKNKNEPLLEVKDLKVFFPHYSGPLGIKTGDVKAVNGVNFSVYPGETFGIVGESGCGKSTVGRALLGVYKPTEGSIQYMGKDIGSFKKKDLRNYHREVQMIFQDPYSSLDPRQTVGAVIAETLRGDGSQWTREKVKEKTAELLTLVELDPSMMDRYPHEMSGGQRQRLGIARALACNPRLIVCDEPVSALDVSIQAQIINLFRKLQKQLGITLIFIAHDLAVVRHISDRIAVMYLGKVVEITNATELYDKPAHPYTQSLLSAVPLTDYYVEKTRQRIVLQGEVPSPLNVPAGCAFHPRCQYAVDCCRCSLPNLQSIEEQHEVACWKFQGDIL